MNNTVRKLPNVHCIVKNTQRMATNRCYSLTIDAKKVVSRRRFEQF